MLINLNTKRISTNLIQNTHYYTKDKSAVGDMPVSNSDTVKVPTYVYFSNINFKANPDCKYLMKYAGVLKCAYSGREMLTPYQLEKVFHSIEKQKHPNVLSGINILNPYQKYMHTIEAQIFDVLKDSEYKTKRNFQDILLELAPVSLARLKEKQIKILNSINPLIATLTDKNLAEEVIKIRDLYLKKIENDEFSRKGPLDSISNIMQTRTVNNFELNNYTETTSFLEEFNQKYKEYEILDNIYKKLYLLPSSTVDFDAFVVKYSKRTHDQIAKALIEPSVATIEHIKPSARKGDNSISNYILVCSDYNKSRSTLNLDKYIDLRKTLDIPETKNIEKHLQDYVNDVIYLTKRGEFKEHLSYAIDLSKSILNETEHRINLDTKNFYCFSKKIKQEKRNYQKLAGNGIYVSKKH